MDEVVDVECHGRSEYLGLLLHGCAKFVYVLTGILMIEDMVSVEEEHNHCFAQLQVIGPHTTEMTQIIVVGVAEWDGDSSIHKSFQC